MYSRKVSRKLNKSEVHSPKGSRGIKMSNVSNVSNVSNASNKSNASDLSDISNDSDLSNDSEESYYDSDESLSEDDEREVSQGIVGEIYSNKYIVLKYLGKGTFSRVWLVYDITTEAFLAMKIVYSKYSEDAEHEVDIYKELGNKYKNVTRYIDSFYLEDEMCIVMELMGICLIDLFKYYSDDSNDSNDSNDKWYSKNNNDDLIPHDIVKKIFKDLFQGLYELHSKNIVHTDLKPENIMINIYPNKLIKVKEWFSQSGIMELYKSELDKILPDNFNKMENQKKKIVRKKARIKTLSLIKDKVKEIVNSYHANIYSEQLKQAENIIELSDVSDLEIEEVSSDELFTLPNAENIVAKIIDLGNAELIEDIEPDTIQLRCYRPPENVLHDFYNTKADIWTMGCILFETLTGDFLFDIDYDKFTDSLEKDKELLVQIYNLIGDFPKESVERSQYKDDLFKDGTNKLLDVENERYNKKTINELLFESPIKNIGINELDRLIDLFNSIFKYDLAERVDAQEILRHPWLSS